MLGGQTRIFQRELIDSFPVDIARSTNGYFLFLEHRYYGESMPMENLTLENLQYLTIEQTLADIYDFVDYARHDLAGNPDASVILIGSNYAGALAVWYHKLYPGTVSIVWASSASLLAKIDFPNYLERVGEIYRGVGGDNCYDRLQVGFETIESLYRNQSWTELVDDFRMCEASTPDNDVRAYLALLITDLSLWAQHRFVNFI